MKKLITYFRGGLGNQLFIYATAYSIAKKNNLKLIADNSDFIKKFSNRRNYKFLLSSLIKNINFRKVTTLNKISWINRIILIIEYRIKHYYKEKIFNKYDNSLMNIKCSTFIKGYFQSYKYFENYKEEIKKIFTENMALGEHPKIILKTIKSHSNTVSIHFRDYSYTKKGDINAVDIMGNCQYNYYKKAIELLNNKQNTISIFIFSNNIDAAKKVFSPLVTKKIFISYEEKYVWEDMFLMSSCDHNIIANSTYSWWAAYLNNNENKIVICPKKWGYEISSKYMDNLIPPEWISI